MSAYTGCNKGQLQRQRINGCLSIEDLSSYPFHPHACSPIFSSSADISKFVTF